MEQKGTARIQNSPLDVVMLMHLEGVGRYFFLGQTIQPCVSKNAVLSEETFQPHLCTTITRTYFSS